jgi:hypothetical protein
MSGKAEFFSEELFTSPSIESTLACCVTMWDGEPRDDDRNPYTRSRIHASSMELASSRQANSLFSAPLYPRH